ncbi:hypothetical protein Pan153_18240 [Gimesia panareensis]|uniref:Methyltransferase domain protein n=1 Tax=Gimesia panareensis TaxID=2527978 RepID=A0A518FLJ3_9PLAN|nr:class I SAM-dependent methyltransferase [Gimesia panareensis]QDV17189.1 hypothetical protein Pan153_18240 [Gimesia panareensis]
MTGYDTLFASINEAHETLVRGPSQYKWLASAKRYVQQSRECIGLAGTRHGEVVYDIGCGPGYLLWICRERLGCSVQGCDPLRDGPIYKELYQALDLNQCISSHVSSIQAPLPATGLKYDVIFATWITWIGFGNWSAEEFSTYIHHCKQHLTDQGRILLRFEESRFEEKLYESCLKQLGSRVAPLCYLFRA